MSTLTAALGDRPFSALERFARLMLEHGLDAADLLLLSELATRANDDGVVRVDRARLAKAVGISTASYKRRQTRLVAAELVSSLQIRRGADRPEVATRQLTGDGWRLLHQFVDLLAGGGEAVPAPAVSGEVEDFSRLAPPAAPAAPAANETIGIEVRPELAQLGVNPDDARVVAASVIARLEGVVPLRDPGQKALLLQVVWSVLVGSTSFRGWPVARRIHSVAKLVREGRWGRPRSMPAGWESAASGFVVLGGSLSVH